MSRRRTRRRRATLKALVLFHRRWNISREMEFIMGIGFKLNFFSLSFSSITWSQWPISRFPSSLSLLECHFNFFKCRGNALCHWASYSGTESEVTMLFPRIPITQMDWIHFPLPFSFPLYRKNSSNLEKFQMRIRKRELYPEDDRYVDKVIEDMVKLPILHVGKLDGSGWDSWSPPFELSSLPAFVY